jgi:hypothetical protein
MPLGCGGSASAVTVAVNLQRTFRGIRVGLLVGVGTTAPSAADNIRLGDVVDSIPADDTGGVIQYAREAAAAASDKDGSNGRHVRVRCMNTPPPALLIDRKPHL